MLRIKHQTKTTEMKKTIRRISAGAFAVGVFVTSFGTSQAATTTLLDLVNGGTITSGNKLFYDFRDVIEVGDISVPLNQIFVTSIQVGGYYGIAFTSAGWSLASNGPAVSYDLDFTYNVTATDPGKTIIGAGLSMVAGHQGGGRAAIEEDLLTTGLGFVGDMNVFLNAPPFGLTDLVDSDSWFPGYTTLVVEKDFGMFIPEFVPIDQFDIHSVAVSEFNQTFSQIPEPASVLSTALLLTSGMLVRRRGKHLA